MRQESYARRGCGGSGSDGAPVVSRFATARDQERGLTDRLAADFEADLVAGALERAELGEAARGARRLAPEHRLERGDRLAVEVDQGGSQRATRRALRQGGCDADRIADRERFERLCDRS